MSVKDEIAKVLVSNQTAPPAKLGKRYNSNQFLPEAGNTVVCALDFDAPAHVAVLKARKRMMDLPEAQNFIYTPQSSLHMTVFEGVIDSRRTPDTWPADFDLSASVVSATEAILQRLTTFTPPADFAVRVVGLRPTGLILDGATPEDAAILREWRDALTIPFGYRHDSHQSYRFHMTFAYPVEWLPDSAQHKWVTDLESILSELVDAALTLPLKRPAFCQFADMNRFDELLVL